MLLGGSGNGSRCLVLGFRDGTSLSECLPIFHVKVYFLWVLGMRVPIFPCSTACQQKNAERRDGHPNSLMALYALKVKFYLAFVGGYLEFLLFTNVLRPYSVPFGVY